MSDVTFQHPDYKSALARWEKVEDAAAGEEAVKKKGEKYLPRPNPTDQSRENTARFTQYVARAVYYNATGRTLQGLIGLAFGEPPAVVLPPALEYAEDDISGGGLPLVQHAQGTLAELLKTGRAGLLVDYPPVETPISRADEADGDMRPTVTFYEATAITNWRTKRLAGKTVLSLVVLKECIEDVEAEGFGSKELDQYRVLRFATNYEVEIWQKRKATETAPIEWTMVEAYTPLRGDGTPWDEIPFTFVGAQNNDWNVDDAPLGDIATLNIAHYRNSADYEDSVYFTGQPQFWIAGLTEEWRDHLEKKGMSVGARSIMPLPINASAGIMQAQPNTLAKEAMSNKEAQMASLGARLIMDAIASKTATQVNSEDAIAHSVLALCCTNLNSAYSQVLVWFAIFANVDGDASLAMPTDFSSYDIDAPTLLALIQGVQSGNIPQTDLWARLRSAGIIAETKTDDQIREEIETQSPQLGALPPDPAEATGVPAVDKSSSESAAA